MSVHWLGKISVSPLFIDYLSLTLAVPVYDEQKIVKNFYSILKQLPNKKELYGEYEPEIKSNDGLYHCRKDVYLADRDEHIRFYCKPRNSSSNFLKIEWIPSKVDSVEVADLVNLILPGGYANFVAYSKITRVDITTLFENIGLNEILYHYPNLKVNKNYAGAGGNESVYLGSPSSEKCFTLYDKQKQIKDKNKKKAKMHKVKVPKNQSIQVEFKFRPKKQIVSLSNLSIVGEPAYRELEILRLRFLPRQITDFDSLVNITISNMQTRGFNKALLMIEGEERRNKVKARVEKLCLAEWWNPSSLWKSLPDAIEPIINPLPNKWTSKS